MTMVRQEGLDDDSCLQLCRGMKPSPSSFVTIDLSRGYIGDRGVQELVKSLGDKTISLRILKLYENRIEDGGAQALARLLLQPSVLLNEVHLSHNSIGPKGGQALLHSAAAAGEPGNPKYPFRESRHNALAPLWLRLEKNKLNEDFNSMRNFEAAMEEELAEIRSNQLYKPVRKLLCTNAIGCNSYHCCRSSETVVHVPHLERQKGLDRDQGFHHQRPAPHSFGYPGRRSEAFGSYNAPRRPVGYPLSSSADRRGPASAWQDWGRTAHGRSPTAERATSQASAGSNATQDHGTESPPPPPPSDPPPQTSLVPPGLEAVVRPCASTDVRLATQEADRLQAAERIKEVIEPVLGGQGNNLQSELVPEARGSAVEQLDGVSNPNPNPSPKRSLRFQEEPGLDSDYDKAEEARLASKMAELTVAEAAPTPLVLAAGGYARVIVETPGPPADYDSQDWLCPLHISDTVEVKMIDEDGTVYAVKGDSKGWVMASALEPLRQK